MAQYSYPWTSIAGDRKRNRDTDSKIYGDLYPNCVYGGLTVTRDGSNAVVAAGSAVVKGRRYASTASETLTPTNGVYSTIVLRMTAADRNVVLVSKAGNSSAYPTLTQTDSVYELPIANVNALGSPFTLTDVRPMYDKPGIVSDTGWVAVSFASGFAGTAEVRRVGNQVWFRGSMSTELAQSGSSSTILTIPEGFRPTTDGAGAATFRPSGNTSSIAGGINTAGSLGVRNIDSTPRSITSMTATYLVD